jgi:hypothetical protein
VSVFVLPLAELRLLADVDASLRWRVVLAVAAVGKDENGHAATGSLVSACSMLSFSTMAHPAAAAAAAVVVVVVAIVVLQILVVVAVDLKD